MAQPNFMTNLLPRAENMKRGPKMLAQAIEAEVDEFLYAHCPVQDGLGRR